MEFYGLFFKKIQIKGIYIIVSSSANSIQNKTFLHSGFLFAIFIELLYLKLVLMVVPSLLCLCITTYLK